MRIILGLLSQLILLVLGVNLVQASPSPETKWLMDEPLSLFDMGMYRTSIIAERSLNDLKDAVNSNIGEGFITTANSYVEYDYDNDRISIEWHITYDIDIVMPAEAEKGGFKGKVETQEELNKLCLSMLKNIKSSTFRQSDWWEITGETKLKKYFGHFGYEKKIMPEKLYRSFASKIIYGVVVHHNTFYAKREEDRNKELRPTLCRIGFDHPLSSTSPMYIDYHKDRSERY